MRGILTRCLAAVLTLAALTVSFGPAPAAIAGPAAGTDWVARTSPRDNDWQSVAYGNGLFVAVSNNDIVGNGTRRVMTSTDGINWTLGDTHPVPALSWTSVAYGLDSNSDPIFVALSYDGATMRSPDGISWTASNAAVASEWTDVAYGGAPGVFVAVGQGGDADKRLMYSQDGATTWQIGTSTGGATWHGVTYAEGAYVMTAFSGSPQLAYSTNGTTMLPATAVPPTNAWWGVTFGDDKYVTVAGSGSGNQAMYSTTADTWTVATTPGSHNWRDVAWGDGTFAAVGAGAIMTSPDASNWSLQTSPNANSWLSVAFAPGSGSAAGMFVAVGDSGTDDRIMTSGSLDPSDKLTPTPTNACVRSDVTLPLRGIRKIMKPGCRVTSGSRVTVEVSGKRTRGDLRLYRVIRTRAGTYLRTFGTPLRLTVKWRALGTSSYYPYRLIKTYRTHR